MSRHAAPWTGPSNYTGAAVHTSLSDSRAAGRGCACGGSCGKECFQERVFFWNRSPCFLLFWPFHEVLASLAGLGQREAGWSCCRASSTARLWPSCSTASTPTTRLPASHLVLATRQCETQPAPGGCLHSAASQATQPCGSRRRHKSSRGPTPDATRAPPPPPLSGVFGGLLRAVTPPACGPRAASSVRPAVRAVS